MGWEISKSFTFAYGHRVWSQVLDAEFSDGLPCKCRHLHGHEGSVEVTLTQTVPDEPLVRGMVTDFNNLAWLKKFLDSTIDHKFIIDSHDPLFGLLVGTTDDGGGYAGPLNVKEIFLERNVPRQGCAPKPEARKIGSVIVVPEAYPTTSPIREYLESFFIVDFVPTSENLSKWLYLLTAWKMEALCDVQSVDWWETAKSHALYVRESWR